MQSVHAKIGLAALMGAALVSSPALAVTAFSPTGNLNVRSGPGFQYQVMNQISANVPVEITGCVSDYSWCSVALPGGATGWASAPYLVIKAAGQAKNMSVVGAQLGIPVVVPTGNGPSVATPPVGVMVPVTVSVGMSVGMTVGKMVGIAVGSAAGGSPSARHPRPRPRSGRAVTIQQALVKRTSEPWT